MFDKDFQYSFPSSNLNLGHETGNGTRFSLWSKLQLGPPRNQKQGTRTRTGQRQPRAHWGGKRTPTTKNGESKTRKTKEEKKQETRKREKTGGEKKKKRKNEKARSAGEKPMCVFTAGYLIFGHRLFPSRQCLLNFSFF